METRPRSGETTRPPISTTNGDEIIVRGHNLAGELLGKLSFTEMMLLDLDGVMPSKAKVSMVDAVLVAMMEHGITPSTLAARLVLDGAPDALQGAIAAGLLATGSRFLGTIETAASLLADVVRSADETGGLEAAAASSVRTRLTEDGRIPGMGHNLHAAVDPRVDVLLALARGHDVAGVHVTALLAVQSAARREKGHGLVANAAGAIAAILLDLGYPARELRGFAAVARCAGVFAHVVDEQNVPLARGVWTSLHASMSNRDGDADSSAAQAS